MGIDFLAVTLFFLLANAAFAKIVFFSIQPDQWMDDLFGWQKMLSSLGDRPGAGNKFLYKALGGCSMCLSHLISLFCFFIYVLVVGVSLGQWFHCGNIALQCLADFVWYVVYVSMATVLCNLAIIKL